MTTKRIGDLPPSPTCRDPQHEPSNMQALAPGVYSHTCPSCGVECKFTVRPKTALHMKVVKPV